MEVILFHFDTPMGEFEIWTPQSTFELTAPLTQGCRYFLRFRGVLLRAYSRPHDAVVDVAQHQTGFRAWDDSAFEVSDYLPDWVPHVDRRLKINLLSEYIESIPNPSIRQMVDYFEPKYGFFLDRLEIKDLYRELLLTGQTTKKLSGYLAPAELQDLVKLAESWIGDSDVNAASDDPDQNNS